MIKEMAAKKLNQGFAFLWILLSVLARSYSNLMTI